MRSVGPASSLRRAVPHRSQQARRVQQQVTSERATGATLPGLKAELMKMTSAKSGAEMTKAEKSAVVEHLKKFEGLGLEQPERMELSGTKWNVIFTNSVLAANCKIGPFTGEGGMTFVSDSQYISSISFFGGAYTIEGFLDYAAGANSKVDLNITRNEVRLLGFLIKSTDVGGLKGYHKMKFADEEMRIFVANSGAWFATVREPAAL